MSTVVADVRAFMCRLILTDDGILYMRPANRLARTELLGEGLLSRSDFVTPSSVSSLAVERPRGVVAGVLVLTSPSGDYYRIAFRPSAAEDVDGLLTLMREAGYPVPQGATARALMPVPT